MSRLYFMGSRRSLKSFAQANNVTPDEVVHVKTVLKVKQIIPGSTVYATSDSVTSIQLKDFCRNRGCVNVVNWDPVNGEH